MRSISRTLPTPFISLKKLTNSWRVMEGENVDFSGVNGTWNNCGVSLTPWNTMLSSEEYEPLAIPVEWIRNVEMMSDYLGEQANPYDYGYLVEVSPDEGGDSVASLVEKRYAMGRFSHEMGIIMPDEITSYHGDDGTGTVLFKFVADEAGDLSTGTLYAAAVTQDDDSLSLKWIELGSADDDEIAEGLAELEFAAE